MAVAGVLEILIKTKDEVSSGLSKAESSVKKSGDKISAWTIAKGQMIGRFFEKAASTTANFAKQTVKSAVNAFADYEQLVGGMDTLFDKSSKKMQRYASNAYVTVGVSANQYMETVTSFSASLIQSLGGDTEKAADVANMAMIDMADNVNKMGSSMESVENAYKGFAKQNYTMLDNLKLGYGGTRTEMERLLKDASDFTGQKYDIKNLSDVYNAIHAIQQKLKITGTTQKEAMTTVTGSFNAAKAAWQDVLVAMGRGKGVKGAVNNFAKTLKTAFKNVRPVVKNAVEGLFKGAKDLFPEIKGMLKDAFKFAKVSIADILHIPDAKNASWASIARKIITNLSGHIGKAGSFIKTLILGDGAEDKTWSDVATELTKKVQTAFSEGGLFDIILGDLSDKAKGFAKFMGDFIKEFASWMTTHTSDITDMIGTIVSALAESIAPVAEAVFSTLVSLLSDEKFYKGLIDGIGNILKGVAKGILGDDAYNFLFGEGKNGEKKGVIPQTLENEKIAGQNTYSDHESVEELQKIVDGEEPVKVPTELKKPEIPDDWNFGDEYTSEEISQMLFGDEKPKVEASAEYEANFSAVESSQPPTLQGTVEYTPAFGDSDFFVAPNGQKVYRRRKKEARGNWNIPYDNYPALLHRGEMVLNKSQARQFRDGVGGGFDVSSAINNAVSAAMSKVYVMMNGDKVGDLTTKRVRRNINARSYNKLRAMGG